MYGTVSKNTFRMKIITGCIVLWLVSTTAIAQGCLQQGLQEPHIIIRGVTCPGCVYVYDDSLYTYKNVFIWGSVHVWTDSVYFAEAIPFDVWNRRRTLLLSDQLWGDEICSALQSFSALRVGVRKGYGVYIEWHTQLYIEVIATEVPVLGDWVYVVSAIHVLNPFTNQQLGIER